MFKFNIRSKRPFTISKKQLTKVHVQPKLDSDKKNNDQAILFDSGTKLGQSRMSRIQMDHSKQSYIDSIADMIHLVGQQYINYLHEGKQQKFYATLLSNLAKVQARDRRTIVEYNFNYKHETNQIQLNFERQQDKVKQWLGEMHFKIVSISFDFLINKQLSHQQVKVYCSQNLLLNIILFLQKVQSNLVGTTLPKLMQFIDNTLKDSLTYLMTKYPQAKQMKANRQLRSEISQINNLQNDNNDMFQFSKIKFQYNQNQDYNSEIMKFINYIIQKMSDQVQIDKKRTTYIQGFYSLIQQIFQSVYLPQQYDKQIFDPENPSNQQQKKNIQQQKQSNKQLKQYKQKVLRYTSYKIGTKINPNTELFTDADIKAGYFEVKSTSILRILTKWIDQLESKILEAKQKIYKRSFRFKNIQKGFSKLNASQKNDIYIQATKQVSSSKQFIKNIRQNAFLIQGQLAMTMKRNKQNINIPKYQYLVGEFSSKLQDTASSSLLSYLNKLIHILLSIPRNIKQKYQHDQDLLRQMDIDLITFKVADLFRCKISSHQNQIIRIYKLLKEFSQKKDIFKIIRIKDRLDLGTRDILVNINFKNVMLCEIQLAITDQIDIKQQSFDYFNHYLYELKRSNLGPIMQSACIWAHLDQRSRIFKKLKQKQIYDYEQIKLVENKHYCKQQLVDNNLPFVCNLCAKFYFSQQGIIKHKKCVQCKDYFVCAFCIQIRMSQQQLKCVLSLDKTLDGFNQDFVKWNYSSNYIKKQKQSDNKKADNNKLITINVPKHGIIIPKKNKNIQAYFFTTIIWKEDAYLIRSFENQSKQKDIQTIALVKGNQPKQWIKLNQSFFIYQWTQKRNINQTVKPQSIRHMLEMEKSKRQKKEEQKKKKIQKEKLQMKKKLGIKDSADKNQQKQKNQQNKNRSRAQSASSENSDKTSKSKVSQFDYENQKQIQNKQSENGHSLSSKKIKKKNKKNLPQNQMQQIEQFKVVYNENFAKKSQNYQFRVAKRSINLQQGDDINQQQFLVLGLYYPQKDIRNKLRKQYNQKIIRQNLQRKTEVLFLEDLSLKEFKLDKKQQQKYKGSLSEIIQLYLDSNMIDTIGLIENMPKLKVIHLSYNLVSEMESFLKLNQLTQIMMDYNKIQEIKGVANNKNLIQLHLNNNLIKKIEGFQNLSKLQVLDLANNSIHKIQSLNDLVNLKKIDLSYNKIMKIQNLNNLTNIQELDLSNNRIKIIENVSELKNIKKLVLKNNHIKQMENLSTLINLKTLDILNLDKNQIKKIKNLQSLTNLLNLNLSGNRINKIKGLKENKNIVDLDLSSNQISQIQSLIDMPLQNIKKLNLSYNGIKQLIGDIFKLMPSIKYFFINGNPINFNKQQKKIYTKLKDEFKKKANFNLKIINEKQNTKDTDWTDNQEEKKI